MHARTHARAPLLGFVEFIFFDARLWGGNPSDVFSRRGGQGARCYTVL